MQDSAFKVDKFMMKMLGCGGRKDPREIQEVVPWRGPEDEFDWSGSFDDPYLFSHSKVTRDEYALSTRILITHIFISSILTLH
jgi:hypothetical protein